MYQPDSAQLVVTLVLLLLAVALCFYLRKYFRGEDGEDADAGSWWGVTTFAVVGFAVLLAAAATLGYVKADRNWDTLATTVEGQRFESVVISFPPGHVERSKVASVEELLEGHAYKSPQVKVDERSRSGGCEIVAVIRGCPLLTISETQYAFFDVYGCRTGVAGVYEFDSPILTAPA